MLVEVAAVTPYFEGDGKGGWKETGSMVWMRSGNQHLVDMPSEKVVDLVLND
ncbi:MAG: hypothetical protein GY832_03040 [Chloroflexi bacterium]|nr:hypothetical protein [Chloroflexota bacterium]